MHDEIISLVISNINNNVDLIDHNLEDKKISIFLKWILKEKKKHFYLEFNSKIWHKSYFLPLGYLNENSSYLIRINEFKLIDILGINLDLIFQHHSINFSISKLYDKAVTDYDEDFNENRIANVLRFMLSEFGIPKDKMEQILKWIISAKFENYNGSGLLLHIVMSEIIEY
jgi:hypothetical protein